MTNQTSKSPITGKREAELESELDRRLTAILPPIVEVEKIDVAAFHEFIRIELSGVEGWDDGPYDVMCARVRPALVETVKRFVSELTSELPGVKFYLDIQWPDESAVSLD